jgi:uncharacterized protein with GYD domain
VAKFLLAGSYGPEALAAAADQGFEGRLKYIESLAESLGMTIETAYFAYGDDDIVLIGDGTSEAALAFSLAVNSSGAVAATITPLITAAEMDAAAAKIPKYEPPK